MKNFIKPYCSTGLLYYAKLPFYSTNTAGYCTCSRSKHCGFSVLHGLKLYTGLVLAISCKIQGVFKEYFWAGYCVYNNENCYPQHQKQVQDVRTVLTK